MSKKRQKLFSPIGPRRFRSRPTECGLCRCRRHRQAMSAYILVYKELKSRCALIGYRHALVENSRPTLEIQSHTYEIKTETTFSRTCQNTARLGLQTAISNLTPIHSSLYFYTLPHALTSSHAIPQLPLPLSQPHNHHTYTASSSPPNQEATASPNHPQA
jgi:hypothetical protein